MKTRTRDEMKRREGMTSREIVVCAACALMMSFAGGVVFADDHDDAATVPAGVGFSGWLTDAEGKPINGETDLVVGVFAEATGGEAVEEFTFPRVEVEDGTFSITLEATNADLWDGSTRWIEVTVEDDVLAPRTAVVSTPYALRAGIATRLTDAAKADVLTETQTQLMAAETRLTDAEAKIATLEATVAALDAKLANVRVEGTDVYFEGVNVHVRDGSGSTYGPTALPSNGSDVDVPNPGSGLGNLIVGYNEEIPGDDPDDRTGQHNLVVGVGHSYRSIAGIVAGYNNETDSHATATLGGWRNEAVDRASVVIGGRDNKASENGSVAVGGADNEVDADRAVVVGGEDHITKGDDSAIVGGRNNRTEGEHSVLVGGTNNTVVGERAVQIAGDTQNNAAADTGAISP